MPSPWLLFLVATLPVGVATADPPARARSAEVVAATCDPVLADLLRDVLASSPTLAAGHLRGTAAAARAAGAGSLPDPMVQLRTTMDRGSSWSGSTDFEVMAMQSLPARGRRRASVAEASSRASSEAASVEAARLDALAEASRWYYELAQLDALEEIRRDELATLRAFAESARGRYGSGAGRQQDPLRAQAEVTRGELSLVELAARRREALAALNEMRGSPTDQPVRPSSLPSPHRIDMSSDDLRERAVARSPSLAASADDIDAARAAEDVARSAGRPDISLGGFYEAMDVGDGESLERDEVGFVIGVSLPIRRRRIVAGVDEAVALRLAAIEARRATEAAVARRVGDALTRAHEARETWDLQSDVLGVQAEASLRSALAGYSTGMATSLEVLESLRVAYDVRALALRAQADFATSDAVLRTLIGGPIPGAPPCSRPAPAEEHVVAEPHSRQPDAPVAPPSTPSEPRRRPRLPRW